MITSKQFKAILFQAVELEEPSTPWILPCFIFRYVCLVLGVLFLVRAGLDYFTRGIDALSLWSGVLGLVWLLFALLLHLVYLRLQLMIALKRVIVYNHQKSGGKVAKDDVLCYLK